MDFLITTLAIILINYSMFLNSFFFFFICPHNERISRYDRNYPWLTHFTFLLPTPLLGPSKESRPTVPHLFLKNQTTSYSEAFQNLIIVWRASALEKAITLKQRKERLYALRI